MADKIYVAVKRPGEPPRHVWMSNSLENFQRYVGGYIEAVTVSSDLVIICNEEGRLLNLPYNCEYCGVDFVGTIVLCGFRGEYLTDCPWSIDELEAVLPDWFEEE